MRLHMKTSKVQASTLMSAIGPAAALIYNTFDLSEVCNKKGHYSRQCKNKVKQKTKTYKKAVYETLEVYEHNSVDKSNNYSYDTVYVNRVSANEQRAWFTMLTFKNGLAGLAVNFKYWCRSCILGCSKCEKFGLVMLNKECVEVNEIGISFPQFQGIVFCHSILFWNNSEYFYLVFASIIFRVQEHPEFPQFIQCVSFNFFPTEWHQTAYNLFCLLALYGVPLFIIIYCYSRILWEISRRSRDTEEDLSEEHHRRDRLRLRRSDMTHIERARARTLRMTIIIVLAFFWCWTPYVVMVLWYMFDPNGAQEVDSQLQSALFMFAVSNSCVNPLVYGSYAINLKQLFRRCYNRTRSSMGFSRQTVVSTTIKTTHTEKDVRLTTTSARGLPVTLKLQGSETIPTLLEETCTPCERQRGSFRSGRLGCSYSNHISYPKYPA
ncbi:uncharacterized protein LOC111637048 [Centruroides sculpturatus]|uniref:uncharacterized protein LOC111637048 n=1 Tax=Centruroides sculpturatus TaxID=218467 RepID=UPI000C6D9A90|nr:uncharacterized protein LOC111637048 [Centruroides sculpturatus]